MVVCNASCPWLCARAHVCVDLGKHSWLPQRRGKEANVCVESPLPAAIRQ